MKFTIVFLLLLSLTLSYRKRSMLRTSKAPVVGKCTIRLILDAGSSGTGGAMGLEHNNEMHNLDIKVSRPDDLKDGAEADVFYKDEIENTLKPNDPVQVKKILGNNLKLSEVTDVLKTSQDWSDAAKIHVTKFFSSDVIVEKKDKVTGIKTKINRGKAKDLINKWLDDNKEKYKCNNDTDDSKSDQMFKISNWKVFMGATAGIRNVINGYVLKDREQQFKDSTDNLKKVLSETGTPPFFADFGFKYIAGRTEGMFGLIVALSKDLYKGEPEKYLYVEMGGASTQVAFRSDKARYYEKPILMKFAKAGSQTGGMILADEKQYFSQSFLGNACDRAPASLVFNYVKDIINENMGVISKTKVINNSAKTNWKFIGKQLTVDMPCLNKESKLVYQKGVIDDKGERIYFKIDTPKQIPSKGQVEDNYNKFMQNKTLYGLYESTYDQMDSIIINGTGISADCKPLVDKYLLGDGDDEYIDHLELKKIEEKLKKYENWDESKLGPLHKLEASMDENQAKALKEHWDKIDIQSQKSQFEQLSKNIKGLSFDKVIVMTNAWGSIAPDTPICDGINTADMTLKAFGDCLPKLCEAKATLSGANSYNYGLCTVAHNLYGIFNNIEKALDIKPEGSMKLQRVISEWSEGPMLVPVNVFEIMKEDLFRGRGSKEFENNRKDQDHKLNIDAEPFYPTGNIEKAMAPLLNAKKG